MINILELSEKNKKEGYSEETAEAKLCQDIILLLLSKSKFRKNITIKGGVVMSSISQNIRRATVDFDFDFIRFPLSIKSIKELVKSLNGIEGIKLKIVGKIEDLKHQDYDGKRVYINIEDSFGNYLSTKVDIGVHKYLEIEQTEYYFDIASLNEGVLLLINSKEQMFTEKLKSLLRFGALSTRYKDIYDMYFLSQSIDISKLLKCINVLIINDPKMRETSILEVVIRIENTFNNPIYLNGIATSKKNWVNVEDKIVFETIIGLLKKCMVN